MLDQCVKFILSPLLAVSVKRKQNFKFSTVHQDMIATVGVKALATYTHISNRTC